MRQPSTWDKRNRHLRDNICLHAKLVIRIVLNESTSIVYCNTFICVLRRIGKFRLETESKRMKLRPKLFNE